MDKKMLGEKKLQNFGLTTTALCDLYIFIIKLYFSLVRSFFFPSYSPVITYPTFLVTRGKGASCQNWKQEVMKLTRISIKSTNLRLQPAGSFVTVTNNLQMLRAQLSLSDYTFYRSIYKLY